MSQANRPRRSIRQYTHEGGRASVISPKQELERSVLACLLWEGTFYEDGVAIADRIGSLVDKVPADFAGDLATHARLEMRLRHAPLLLNVALARAGKLRAETLADCIQRADELAEFLALYWADGKCPLSGAVKKGLAAAFGKFDAYQLAKYNRDREVRLRDVMFMVHPKPRDEEQAQVWKKLADKTLEPPDTWEVALSAGKSKKDTFMRLMAEKRLPYMALLMNLRNIRDAGVPKKMVADYLLSGASRSPVLPFKFVAAAKTNPEWEDIIEPAMLATLGEVPKLPGKTVLLVDVSGSMDWGQISKRSILTRMDAATALAILVREVCEDAVVATFSQQFVTVPLRRGFGLGDAIAQSQPHSATYLRAATLAVARYFPNASRTIVFTDEQSHDGIGRPTGRGYLINVASYERGVGYGEWTHITGFSEHVLEYVRRDL